MDHLAEESDIISLPSARSYLRSLGVQLTPGVEVLHGAQKIKIVVSLNLKAINPMLDDTTRAMYQQSIV